MTIPADPPEDGGDCVFAPLGGELRRMTSDGSLRAEIDSVVNDPDLAVG